VHRTAQRRVIAAAALGALATIVAGVFLQGNLKLAYYHCRMRLEPSFLLRVIEEPPASLEHLAASRFLDESAGRSVLFRAYLTHLAEEIDPREAEPHRAFTVFGGQRVWFDASYSGRRLETGESYCDGHQIVAAIKRFLPRLEGDVYRAPGADGFEFSIVTSDQAVQLYRRSIPDIEIGSVFTFRGSDPYVCRVRRAERDPR
jgi:hypothetical protein